MPQFIIVRLHPTAPTDGALFTDYLSDLTITASDVSFGDQRGQVIGDATYDSNPNETDILQDEQQILGISIPLPAATARIEVVAPAGRPEHATIDLILNVTRNGVLVHDSIHYNVPVIDVPAPFAWQGPVAAYVPLPDPGVETDPTDAYVELPADGSPPSFEQLRTAVEAVLADDPGAAAQPDLSALTPEQCSHIALEILAKRSRRPLPEPPRPLGELYGSDDLEIAAERERFEAELLAYHSNLAVDAWSLGRYVFAMSAALDNEGRSDQAEQVRFRFPVRPEAVANANLISQAEVILTQ
jgi:hypothetical protein